MKKNTDRNTMGTVLRDKQEIETNFFAVFFLFALNAVYVIVSHSLPFFALLLLSFDLLAIAPLQFTKH